MAYIPWWQRMSPPTFAERFDLGGLAGRVGLKPGGIVEPGITHYATEGTKAVREYLSTLEPGTTVRPLELSKKYKIARKNLYNILAKEYPKLKLLGRTEATKLTQKILSEKRLATAVDVPTPISKLRHPGSQTRDYIDVRWPSDKIKEDYIKDFKQKRSGTKVGTSGLSNKELAKKYFGKINNSTLSNVERVNMVLENQLNIKYVPGDPTKTYLKRKENLQKAEKYASVQDLKDVNAIKNKKAYLNKYFKDNPNAINETEFGKKIKNQMDIRINDKGEIYFNKRPNKYYIEKATSKNGIFSIFDINAVKTGERFLRVSDNLNLSTKQFNEAFIEGQVNRFFKKDGKLHNNKEALNKVIKILNKYNIRVKIDDVGRIGEHEKVAATGKENRTYPRVTKSLQILGLPETLTNFSENVSVSNRTKPQIFARKILDTGQKAWSKLPFKNLRILPSGALAATDFTLMTMMGMPVSHAALASSAWLTKKPEIAKTIGAQVQSLGFIDEMNQKKAEEDRIKNLEAAHRLKIAQSTAQDIKPFELEKKATGGLSGVDQYMLNRYK